jgi:hypothetical protein
VAEGGEQPYGQGSGQDAGSAEGRVHALLHSGDGRIFAQQFVVARRFTVKSIAKDRGGEMRPSSRVVVVEYST